MSLWPLPIETAINLATFLLFPLSLVLMVAVAMLPSRIDRLAFLALALANGVLCHAIFITFDAVGDRFHIGAWIARLAWFAFLGAVAMGLACLVLRRASDAPPTWLARAVCSLALAAACLVLLFWIAPFARWPGALVVALLGLLAALCLHQWWRPWPQSAFGGVRSQWRSPYRAAMATLGVSLLVSIGLALFTAARVAGAAAEAAAGRPYCIYPAGGFFDLTMLTLREPRTGDWRTPHEADHALLVIKTADGPVVLNWSYRFGAFRSDHKADPFTPPATELCRPG